MASAAPRAGGLTATQLKYFAAFIMVLDHFNMLFGPLDHLYPDRPLAARALYLIGRMAFPVFVFLMAEGMRHTKNRRAYLIRLGIFGGATQLPFLLGLLEGSGSVIATFFLAAAGVFTYDRLRAKFSKWLSILPLLFFALLAHLAPTDYGWLGVLTAAGVYLAGSRSLRLIVLAFFMGVEYLVHMTGGTIPGAADWLAAGAAWLAVLLLALLYNGERGRGSKWFFYWFYPLHLIVLGGLSMIL